MIDFRELQRLRELRILRISRLKRRIVWIVCSGLLIVFIAQNIMLGEAIKEKDRLFQINETLIAENSNLKRYTLYPILCTVYNAEEKQTDNTPTITASGQEVCKYGVAVSREFEKMVPLGSKIQCGTNTILIVNDRMNSKKKGLRMDIFHPDRVDFKTKMVILKPFNFEKFWEGGK